MRTVTLFEPTTSNIRAEMARYRLESRAVAFRSKMHPTMLSNYLQEQRPLTQQAAARIATAINELVGEELFSTELTDP